MRFPMVFFIVSVVLSSTGFSAGKSVSAAQKVDDRFIQGIWKGYQPMVKDSVAFVFYTKNRGRTYTKGQLVSNFIYKVDFSKTPISLDMTQKGGKSLAIIQFIGRDTMFMKMSLDTVHLKAFAKGFDSTACVLIRVPMQANDTASKGK